MGDPRSPDELIAQNLPLVRWVVAGAIRSGARSLSFEDLESEGRVGLIKAARTFRPELGFTFATYAVRCVRRAVWTALTREWQAHGRKNGTDRYGCVVGEPMRSYDAGPMERGAAIREAAVPAGQEAAVELAMCLARMRAACRTRADRLIYEAFESGEYADARAGTDVRIAAVVGLSRERIRQRRARLTSAARHR